MTDFVSYRRIVEYFDSKRRSKWKKRTKEGQSQRDVNKYTNIVS